MATLSEALKEVYASAPIGEVIIDTLEFQHPNFVDDNGNAAPFRVVNQYEPVTATIESTAAFNPGEAVTFQAFAFDVQLPGFESGQVPELSITIDNVGRELMEQLELAASSQQPIKVIYRPYLLTDLTAPQMDPPIEMQATDATALLQSIQFKASMDSVNNFAFPRRIYKVTDFPDLAR